MRRIQSMTDESPGWDAITAAVEALYPGSTPVHVAPGSGVHFGSGVQGISAYPTSAGHWHYVTYGLSELWAKESADLEQSGFGYEFTIRVPRSNHEERPPEWPFNLAEQLARSVRGGADYWIGHRLDLGGQIDGRASRLTAIAFVLDPQLGSIDTLNGKVTFLQLFGITHDE